MKKTTGGYSKRLNHQISGCEDKSKGMSSKAHKAKTKQKKEVSRHLKYLELKLQREKNCISKMFSKLKKNNQITVITSSL